MSQNELFNDSTAPSVSENSAAPTPVEPSPELSIDADEADSVALEEPAAEPAAASAADAPVAEEEVDSAQVVQVEAPFVVGAEQQAEEESQIVREEESFEPLPPVKSEMVISVVPGEECRIAITVDGKLDDYFQERAGAESHVGGIYKGRIRQINTAVQAAFVDIGLPQNAFLHISDVHPRYFPGAAREEVERVGIKTARRDRPLMQQCFKKGDEVLVQVIKEGLGSKGPTVTAYLSVPGRYIVMMPWMDELGVSKKVEDQRQRAEMRDMLRDLKPPEGFGFILRTEAAGKSIEELRRDLNYLQRVWQNIDTKRAALKGLGEMYAESDLVIRTLRDIYTPDTKRITVDDLASARRCRDFLRATDPNNQTQVLYYQDQVPLFHRKNIEAQIQNISDRTVPLPSGGALVIDQTEAMVAIDVNSGRSRGARDAESNAFETNKEAVDEICRQLRLRDLGGIVCLDLIDMFQIGHRKRIEQRLLQNLKRDRAKTNVGIISPVCGVLPMTRQRMRPSISKNLTHTCPHCSGTGVMSTPEAVGNAVLRRLQMVLNRADVARVELTVSGDVAFILLNTKRGQLAALEKQCGKQVLVRVGGKVDAYDITAVTLHGIKVVSTPDEDVRRLPPEEATTLRDVDDPSLPEDVGTEFREDDLILQDHTVNVATPVKPFEKPAAKLAQPAKPFEKAQKPKVEAKAEAKAESGKDPAKEHKSERKQDGKQDARQDAQKDDRQDKKPTKVEKQAEAAPATVAPAFVLPEGVPPPPKNFPGIQQNKARARVFEVMEALDVPEADMVAFVRQHNLERIQSVQTRMTCDEVLMAWAHFKGGAGAGAPAEPQATDAPAPAKAPAQAPAPATEAPAPKAKVFIIPALPEQLAAQGQISIHDLTVIIGMSVSKMIKIAHGIDIPNLQSGKSTVDAPTATRLLDAASRAKAAASGMTVMEAKATPVAVETPVAREAPAAPAEEETPAPKRGGRKAKAEPKGNPPKAGKGKAETKVEKPKAEEPKPEAKPAKGKKPAGKTAKAEVKAQPKAETKAQPKAQTQAKPAPAKEEAPPAAPKFRKRQAPPVPGETGKRKLVGGPKRGRE